MRELVLASKSPRRQALIKLLQRPFIILTQETNEDIHKSLTPEEIVQTLSLRKASDIKNAYALETENRIIVAADTIVVMGKEILNKPLDVNDAFRMLSLLQGKTHEVYTGFTLMSTSNSLSRAVKTLVTFSKMSPHEIKTYIDIAKPFDKAGAYGIQDDFGACFIEQLSGCYYNVVGLPISKLHQSLIEFES